MVRGNGLGLGMGWITTLYIMMAALSVTIAGIYLAAWLLQREARSYLLLALLGISIAGLAGTELWILRAQTPEEYAIALRWFQVPIWSGFLALLGLVGLRLRPRFAWLGWLAVGLRTVALVANFVSGPNLNYAAVLGIERFTLLGEPVATAIAIPNPWMLTGQAALLSSILFLIDAGVSSWRRGEGARSLVLTISLFVAVLAGTTQAVLVFWGFVQSPILITPLFLFVAVVMGAELSHGLLRAARAERDMLAKDAALQISEARLSLAAEAADAGFWSLDQSGHVWATAKSRELFALAPGAELNLPNFLDRVHMHDRERLKRRIEEAFRSHDRFRAEFRVVDPEGGVRWLSSSGRSEADSEAGSKTLMGVSVDITAPTLSRCHFSP
jgi:two-component system sensor kinase FixL